MWDFPLLCGLAKAVGRTPSFCPVEEVSDIDEIVEVEAIIEPEVIAEPEVVGTLTSCWGVTGDVMYYPAEPIYKYGIIFPPPNHIWNKPHEFRTYENVEWYVTDVMHSGKCPTAEDEPVVIEDWILEGKFKDSKGKIWHVYRQGRKRKVVDPLGVEEDRHFDTWMEMNAWLHPPAALSMGLMRRGIILRGRAY